MRLTERARQPALLTDAFFVLTLVLAVWAAALIVLTFVAIAAPTYYGFPKAGLKAVGATVVGLLALSQVYTMEARLGHLPRAGIKSRSLLRTHHWVGRIALTLAAVVAIFCMTDIGATTTPLRAVIHESLGTVAFAAAATKFALLRFRPELAMRVAPSLGRVLAIALMGIWFTSAYEYFTGTL
jgi:hypothetical protein